MVFKSRSKKDKSLRNLFLNNAIVGVLTLAWVVGQSSDPKNVWLFGFSKIRMLVIFGILFLDIWLLWFATQFGTRTRQGEKISKGLSGLTKKKTVLWILTGWFVVCLFFCIWFLIQWSFLATDLQLRAYLNRGTPVSVLAVLISLQWLVFIGIHLINGEREKWIFWLIILGGYVFFLWFFVGEFYLTEKLFPEYFVVERFGSTLQTWMPYILFQTVIFLQLPFLLKEKISLKSDFRWFGVILLFIVGYFYHTASENHAEIANSDIRLSDQSAYVKFTRSVIDSGYRYTGLRNQTPGYPYLQAMFCKGDVLDQEIFVCGKRVNILLSELFLFSLFLIGNKLLSPESALSLTLITTFSLFIFKAGYFSVELSYYFMNFLGFWLMMKVLLKPSPWLGVVTGIILGIESFLKNAVLPSLLLFTVIYSGRALFILIQEIKISKQKSIRYSTFIKHIIVYILVLTGYLGIVSPYLIESKEIYGHYFYNVNSEFYIWYDSWGEAKQAAVEYGFENAYPDFPEGETPGIRKYIQDHTLTEIIGRFKNGFKAQTTYLINSYSNFNYLIIFSLILGFFWIININQSKELIRRYWPPLLFSGFYFIGYTILYAWYNPIGEGPRFIYSLYLPALSVIIFGIHRLIEERSWKVFGQLKKQEEIFKFINMITIAFVVFDAYLVIVKILPNGYFGS